MAHVQLARIAFDPAHQPLAETALRLWLAVRPFRNAAALIRLGALAAARHDFTTALDLARRAVTANGYSADGYSADGYGVLTDAYVGLGPYPQAPTRYNAC